MTDAVSPAPLYLKVKDHILANIRSGRWAPGARVPSENELVSAFSISRMTANRALRELTQEGWLSRLPGVGSFVRERTRRTSLMELRNIADEIAERGHVHTARTLLSRTAPATPPLMDEFEIASPEPLRHVVIAHLENGLPVQLEDRYVNLAVAPGFADVDPGAAPPTAWLVANVPVDELEHTVEAAMPDADTAHHLAVAASEPCLVLNRRSWSDGRVVTVVRLTYPASRYALHSRYAVQPNGARS